MDVSFGVRMLDKTFKKNPNVVTRQVAGETILVPISGNIANMEHIFSLNDVAEFIWTHMDGQETLQQLIEKMTDDFEVDSGQAVQDSVAFMQSLIEQQLVEEVK